MKKQKERRRKKVGSGKEEEEGRGGGVNEGERLINLIYADSTKVHFFLITFWKRLTPEKGRMVGLSLQKEPSPVGEEVQCKTANIPDSGNFLINL